MSCLPALAMAAARMTLQLLHITSASGWFSLKASAGSSQLGRSASDLFCSIARWRPLQQAIAHGSRCKLSRHHDLLCHCSRQRCTATDVKQSAAARLRLGARTRQPTCRWLRPPVGSPRTGRRTRQRCPSCAEQCHHPRHAPCSRREAPNRRLDVVTGDQPAAVGRPQVHGRQVDAASNGQI